MTVKLETYYPAHMLESDSEDEDDDDGNHLTASDFPIQP